MARAPGRRDEPQPLDARHGRPLEGCGSRSSHHGIRVPYSTQGPLTRKIKVTTSPPPNPAMTPANIARDPKAIAGQRGRTSDAPICRSARSGFDSQGSTLIKLHDQFCVRLVAARDRDIQLASAPARWKGATRAAEAHRPSDCRVARRAVGWVAKDNHDHATDGQNLMMDTHGDIPPGRPTGSGRFGNPSRLSRRSPTREDRRWSCTTPATVSSARPSR